MNCKRKINQEYYDQYEGYLFNEICGHPESIHDLLKGCQAFISSEEYEDNDGRWITVYNVCACEGFK